MSPYVPDSINTYHKCIRELAIARQPRAPHFHLVVTEWLPRAVAMNNASWATARTGASFGEANASIEKVTRRYPLDIV
jgi:hypothetical protein